MNEFGCALNLHDLRKAVLESRMNQDVQWTNVHQMFWSFLHFYEWNAFEMFWKTWTASLSSSPICHRICSSTIGEHVLSMLYSSTTATGVIGSSRSSIHWLSVYSSIKLILVNTMNVCWIELQWSERLIGRLSAENGASTDSISMKSLHTYWVRTCEDLHENSSKGKKNGIRARRLRASD